MDKKIKIYRLHHRQNNNINNNSVSHIINLQVGASLNNYSICDIKDNNGDNISNLNPIYSELTGHYWVWKNDKKSNYVGFEHYRRNFNLNENEIITCLKNNDIIVFNCIDINISVEEHYKMVHSEHDINMIKDIILELYPEYEDSYNKYITNGYRIIPCNSFISSWNVFDDLMTFLFTIFNSFNKKLCLNTYDDYYNHILKYSKHINNKHHESYGAKWENYQLRIFGFLAERLMTLYIFHNFKNIKYIDYKVGPICPMINTISPKKAIILVMSCNQERYVNEEHIIRKTWGKNIIEGKYNNLDLLFYRGGSDKTYFDNENKVINLVYADDLNSTYNKTLEVFKYVNEKYNDFDYIIRTNTSTYINVEAILQFLEIDDLKDDVMYGSRLIINNTNLNIPFLGGHFMIIPRKICNILLNSDIKPKCPDDLSIGYVLGKKYGYNYLSHLLEVDSVVNINEPYNDKLYKSYCVRIKDEKNNENNIINMIGFHTLYKNITVKVGKPHGFTEIETLYGKIPI